MRAVYTRTQSCIDLEERTGKNIEDFLDDSCFVQDEEYDDDDEDGEFLEE
mgnify:CR=1 FL=1